MATYAVGDIQGCYGEFRALLARIRFQPERDRLWLVGDLVNRGPHSLAVLRAVVELGDAAVTVLGNHDLHLLARARIAAAAPRRRDTLDDVLSAPDREQLIDWLRRRPLLHYDASLNVAMVHAGLAPQWTLEDALARAREVETALTTDIDHFLGAMYGDEPRRWDDALAGLERLRFITNCLTRMRYCDRDGALSLDEKGAPEAAGATLQPWFAVAERRSGAVPIVFGHWSTLRLDPAQCRQYNVYPLDTGAVWGGRLTALRLEDRRWFSVPSQQAVALE